MAENKREHFRVDDMAQVRIRYVPRNNVKQVAEEIFYGTGLAGIVLANQKVLESIAAIKARDSQLSMVMEAMNEKMDEILKIAQGGAVEKTQLQPINFSVGGCRFFTNEAYSLSETIDITIRFSNNEEIRALALVRNMVKAKETKYGQYEMAVQFRAISKANSAIIERHVMQKQQEELRARAEARRNLE
jgi:hypothetical protein